MKPLEIRPARMEERPKFRRLWRKYLEGQLRAGGDIVPTSRTLAYFDALFALYTSGDLEGVVMLALDAGEPVGVVFWGETPNQQMDVRWKKPAQGWGTYVEPRYRGVGASDRLREAAKKELRERGFDVVVGAALNNNSIGVDAALSAGFVLRQSVGYLEL